MDYTFNPMMPTVWWAVRIALVVKRLRGAKGLISLVESLSLNYIEEFIKEKINLT